MNILNFLFEALMTAVAYLGIGIVGISVMTMIIVITYIQATE